MIIVYTCILNNWDHLRTPAVVDPNARYICFTDQPMPKVDPWEFLPAYLPYQQMARNSRLPKILPHLHFEAEYSVYHDGNFALRQEPAALIDRYLGARDIALFKHPCRKSVKQETDVLLGEKIGNSAEVVVQYERWKDLGEPEGLWCGGMIIRRHTEAVQQFNQAWWAEFMAGSTRDQMALPVAKHLTRIDVTTIDGDVYDNDLMAYHWHAAWKHKGDNPIMELRRKDYIDRRKRLVEVAG
jgi:hypothetical protein